MKGRILRSLLLLLTLVVFVKCSVSSPGVTHEQACITSEEAKLYDLINKYRKENGLTSIPLSSSLTIVAQAHVRDLSINSPEKSSCNMHSWSGKGNWKACCYTDDHKNPECMWNKPSELTEYTGKGYEIATKFYRSSSGEQLGQTAENALKNWKKSSPHNNVILNKGIWGDVSWSAIGIGIYGGYAVIWFGEEKDLARKLPYCN